jgi:uncharacterized membrane protein (UPF0127 family)
VQRIAAGGGLWLGLLLLAACERAATQPTSVAPPSPPVTNPALTNPWLDDGRPQSGLARLKLLLGSRELNAELALTDDAIHKGMMWRTNVSDTDGMLFVFGRPHQTSFWMKNVPINIDVAYIDPEGVIREIHTLQRLNTNPVPAKVSNIQFALETAEGWFDRHGIRPGVLIRTEGGTLREAFFSPRKGRP